MKRGVVFVVVGAVAVLAAVVLWERRGRPSEPAGGSHADGESRPIADDVASSSRAGDSETAPTDVDRVDGDRATTDDGFESERGEADREAASPRRTIEGRVVDDRGEALPGAIVRASGANEPVARTDAEGRFAIEVDSTVEALDVTASRHEPTRLERLADLEGEARLELARQAMRRVVVETPDGRLLAGAHVAMDGVDAQSTDERGFVRFEPAPLRESVQLEVAHSAYESIVRTLLPIRPGEHRTTVVRMEDLRPRTTLAIVVRDPERRPIADASVQIRHGVGAQVTDFHRTDSAGRVVLEDPGSSWMSEAFGVRVTADGFRAYGRTEIRADVIPEELDVVLYREGFEIQVQLVDREGRPRGGCTVRARKADGTGATLVAQTDWQGIARFSRQLESVPYDVMFGSGVPGGFLPEGGRVVVEPIGYLSLDPKPTVSARSRVVDAATLEGRVVRASDASSSSPSMLRLSCHAGRYVERAFFTIDVPIGAEGEFRVEGLPAGFYRAWLPGAAGGGGVRLPLAVVPLDIGESRTDVEVRIAAPAVNEER